MSQRTNLIADLITHIENSTDSTGHRGYRFLHEINSFPSFYIATNNERRIHRGAGTRYALVSCTVRGYCWGDTLDTVEAYARNIEQAIQTFRATNTLVEEMRVTSLATDEGTMAPYGIVDIIVETLYELVTERNIIILPQQYNLITQDQLTIITQDGEAVQATFAA